MSAVQTVIYVILLLLAFGAGYLYNLPQEGAKADAARTHKAIANLAAQSASANAAMADRVNRLDPAKTLKAISDLSAKVEKLAKAPAPAGPAVPTTPAAAATPAATPEADNGVALHSKIAGKEVNISFPPPDSLAPNIRKAEPLSAAQCGSGLGSMYRNPRGTIPGHEFAVCHHGAHDTIGGQWTAGGMWHECPPLLSMAFLAYELSDYRTEDGVPNVVDVGANIGSCTLTFINSGVCPVAFEPAPVNMKAFVSSMKINGFDCPKLVFAGLSEVEMQSHIRSTQGNKGHAVVTEQKGHIPGLLGDTVDETIQLTRLDYVVKHHVHFLKVDVQGFEEHVFKSSENLFKNFEPPDIIFFEINPSLITLAKSRAIDIVRWLHKWGYKIMHMGHARVLTERELKAEIDSMAPRPLAEANYLAVSAAVARRMTPAKFMEIVHGQQPWMGATKLEEYQKWAKEQARS